MKYMVNSFSLNMISEKVKNPVILTREVASADVPDDVVSAIGHVDTAVVVSGLLGRAVPANRITVSLDEGDEIYVAQYYGHRLQEGATTLPEGARIRFYQISIWSYAGIDRYIQMDGGYGLPWSYNL
jgi:hypothetical protein